MSFARNSIKVRRVKDGEERERDKERVWGEYLYQY